MTAPEKKAIYFLITAGVILWAPVVHVLLGGGPGFLGELGFQSGPPGTPLAWVLGFVAAIFYAGYTVRSLPSVRKHWAKPSLAKLVGVLAAVPAAIVEEAVFRRMLMDAVMNAAGSVPLQVLVSGVVFGLAHGVWALVTRRWTTGAGVIVATGLLGVAFGLVYVIGGRSLAPVIAAHFVVTATIQPGILIAVFSGERPRRPVAPAIS